MQRTQSLRALGPPEAGRANTILLGASALVLAGTVYAVLVLRPGLVKPLIALLGPGALTAGAPSWVGPSLVAGVAISAVVLTFIALAAFVRGVQMAPYAWLSPILVAFSTLVLARMDVVLPLRGVSVSLFAPLAALLVIGGGALIQLRNLPSTLSGSLLLLLPLATLVAGYVSATGSAATVWSSLPVTAQLFLFVLTLTSVGVALVAFVARQTSSDTDSRRTRDWNRHRDQLAQALEQVRNSELRVAEAEQRAELAEYNLRAQGMQLAAQGFTAPPMTDDEAMAFAAKARPGLAGMLVVLGCLLAGGAAAVTYFATYLPLAKRTSEQRTAAALAFKTQGAEVDALRKHFEAQQAGLRTSLAAEQSKAKEAFAQLEQARGEIKAQVVEQQAAPGPKAATRRVTARTKARAPRAAKAKAAAKVDAPAGAPALDRETRNALRESVNDDPIGGL